MTDLTLSALRRANVERCESTFHPLDAWSLTDWATAAAGEMGEACNVVKKIRRFGPEHDDLFFWETRVGASLRRDLADEIADTVIYLDLLAARAGIDLGEAVREKFNAVSARVDSAVRL